ncbi:MAG: P1 family peptidase [Pseudomonadota bacterium]
MARPGPRNALTDVPGLKVGCAEDSIVVTGVTVIVPDERAVCAVDVRGGGPGTRETDALQPENLVDAIDALVFSGGSVYGLGAADGVVSAMGAEGKGFGLVERGDVPKSPVVPGAILYDLANGGAKAWGDSPPYNELARRAYVARDVDVPLGNAGAGYGAIAGGLKGGQGSASIVGDDGETVAALACVNCWGATTMPNCHSFWAWPWEIDGEFGGARPDVHASFDLEDWGLSKTAAHTRANTTLCVVATDVALTPSEAKRMAQMATAGLARAIRPVFAPFDGDVVFALSTGKRAITGLRPFIVARLGALAADCLARAIARGVYEAHGLDGIRGYRDPA